MLMLSTFRRVRDVSALVPRLAAAGRRACRRRTLRAVLAPPPLHVSASTRAALPH